MASELLCDCSSVQEAGRLWRMRQDKSVMIQASSSTFPPRIRRNSAAQCSTLVLRNSSGQTRPHRQEACDWRQGTFFRPIFSADASAGFGWDKTDTHSRSIYVFRANIGHVALLAMTLCQEGRRVLMPDAAWAVRVPWSFVFGVVGCDGSFRVWAPLVRSLLQTQRNRAVQVSNIGDLRRKSCAMTFRHLGTGSGNVANMTSFDARRPAVGPWFWLVWTWFWVVWPTLPKATPCRPPKTLAIPPKNVGHTTRNHDPPTINHYPTTKNVGTTIKNVGHHQKPRR